MKLIALIVALILERLATHLFHLRSLRWLDRCIDPLVGFASRHRQIPAVISALIILGLLLLPLILVWLLIDDALLGIPFVVLSVVVLFFSLGPEDIFEEVSAWCRAVSAGDEESEANLSKAILECDPRPNSRISDAIFVQGNNRIFAVVFWFIVAGPIGAAIVRIADLIRRRTLFQQARRGKEVDEQPEMVDATEAVHAFLAWIPARLSALSYILAGSFDSGWAAWRSHADTSDPQEIGERTDQLLARVGCASLSFVAPDEADADEARVAEAQSASRLLMRALLFWAVAVAALTILGGAI